MKKQCKGLQGKLQKLSPQRYLALPFHNKMGIPKYYRWISERYPCLSRVVREHEVGATEKRR